MSYNNQNLELTVTVSNKKTGMKLSAKMSMIDIEFFQHVHTYDVISEMVDKLKTSPMLEDFYKETETPKDAQSPVDGDEID